jgi:hypothetical protein
MLTCGSAAREACVIDFLNRFKDDSLIGAVADPSAAMELATTGNPPKMGPQKTGS